MVTPINILMVEDSDEDAFFILHALTNAGIQLTHTRVDNPAAFQRAISEKSWDIVLCDYSLPAFSGIEALKLLREYDRDIPFIFVSGTLLEEQGVEAMRSGANDYILKDKLTRLAPAIERSIVDAKIKKERKIYEKQFIQSQKMESLGQLTGEVAHNFNNILMIIQSNLDAFNNNQLNKNQQKYFEDALQAVQMGADLINCLMAFSRLQQLQPKLLKLQEVIPRVVKLLTSLLGATIKITMHIPDDTWNVCLDIGQFENALINLAINARDAMNGKGSLAIDVSNFTIDELLVSKPQVLPGDYVKISVTDRGCGIPAENLDRIFEPFFTTKEVGKGTGLGLSMLYGFVKQSHGFVSIYSEVGYGSTINLYLPKSNVTQTHSNALVSHQTVFPPVIKRKSQEANQTILLAEDEPTLRDVIAEHLKNLGYRVLQVNNGKAALKMLKKERNIQLLLTDILMPEGLTANELVKKALENDPLLKIIFMSGYPKHVLLNEQYITSEEHPVLVKPFTRSELQALLETLFYTEESSLIGGD